MLVIATLIKRILLHCGDEKSAHSQEPPLDQSHRATQNESSGDLSNEDAFCDPTGVFIREVSLYFFLTQLKSGVFNIFW